MIDTIWQIVQILFLLILVVGSSVLFIALFHPIRFDLRLRGSIKGQRAELWFVYLFNFFKIGIVATPHTQNVLISVFGFKKILTSQGRKKPSKPDVFSSPVSPAPTEKSIETEKSVEPFDFKPVIETEYDKDNSVLEDIKVVEDIKNKTVLVEPNEDLEQSEQPEQPKQARESEALEKTVDSLPDSLAIKSDTIVAEKTKPLTEESVSDVSAIREKCASIEFEAATKTDEVSPETVIEPDKETDEKVERGKKAVTEKTATENNRNYFESFRKVLRALKKKASAKYNQFKHYARLFRQKWRLLIPIAKRFWHRGKKAFSLPRVDLMLKYALHEPSLTGMCQGAMAVISGIAGQWGINFTPIPIFEAPTIYSRAHITAVVKPWRMFIAVIGLLLERQLYIEIWQLFKWYRKEKRFNRK